MNSEILKEEIREETIRWLDSLKKTIGQPQHQALWHYAKAIDIAIKALSTETKTRCIAQIKVDTEEIVRRIKEEYDITDKWIPCSERLPKEEKKTYWVCTNTEYQCECRWTNNRFGIGEGEWGWSVFDTPQYTKPIAWMSLPTPYKGDDGE